MSSGSNPVNLGFFTSSYSPLAQSPCDSSSEEDFEVEFHLPKTECPGMGSPDRSNQPMASVPETPVARIKGAANRQLFDEPISRPSGPFQRELAVSQTPRLHPNLEGSDLLALMRPARSSSPFQEMSFVPPTPLINRTRQEVDRRIIQEGPSDKVSRPSLIVPPTPKKPRHSTALRPLAFSEQTHDRLEYRQPTFSKPFGHSNGAMVSQTPALNRKRPIGVFGGTISQQANKRGLFASDSTSSASSSSQVGQKAEMKVHPYLAGANQVAENMEKLEKDGTPFSLQIGEHTVTITQHCETFTPGDYCNAYLVKGEGLEDEFFVLKVLKEEWRVRKPKKGAIVGEQEVEQYAKINQRFADLNCIAKHFDLEILAEKPFASMTHGCHLVRYIPYKYPVPKYTKALAAQGSIERRADEQLKKIYERAQQTEDEALDLRWQNVGMDRDWNIVVIDPMTPDPDDEEDSAFSFVREPGLHGFAGDQKSERYQFLNPKKEV